MNQKNKIIAESMEQLSQSIQWRDIAEFSNYEISSSGLIRNKRTGRIMKVFNKGRNYPTVALFKDGKTFQRFIHRLVAFAYVPNDNPGVDTDVHHIDENKMNYQPSNLVWGTQAGNINDYIERHRGNTHIDRMKKTLSSPVVLLDYSGTVLQEFDTPQATGYHCKEFYQCLKNQVPFRGDLYVYKDNK